MKMDKQALRQAMLEQRDRLSSAELSAASKRICADIVNSAYFKQAQTVMAFVPFRKEIAIKPMIEHAWNDGKVVLLPKVNKTTKQIDVYQVRSWQELQPGVWGILEPSDGSALWQGEPGIDLIIMPGLAFDRSGNRLGYGGGYYDGFLTRLLRTEAKKPVLAAVAYHFQIQEHIPHEAWDYPVDWIITEQERIKAGLAGE